MSELADLVAELVSIDSVNPDLIQGAAGEERIARFVAGWLEAAGVEVRIDEVAPGRANVIGIARGTGNGRRLLFNGHTDTVGSMAYNQRLSERRADAVKTEMVREGLTSGDISTVGRNFSEPLVPTGPGVREPQNRRAVIDLGR